MSEGRRWMYPFKQRANLPFHCFRFHLGPDTLVIFFTQFTDSNRTSSEHTLTDTPNANVSAAIRHLLAQSRHIKLTITAPSSKEPLMPPLFP